MAEIVVIADDLTGANATLVLFAKKGFRTGSFIGQGSYLMDNYQSYDVVAISTQSRAIEREVAYNRVAEIVRAFQGEKIKLFSKRIDTTMRGNIGAEIDAVLDVLGGDYTAIVVPVFPASGRITVGSHLLVNSVPLERTDVANDPKTPVNKTYVPGIIQEQSKYSVGTVLLQRVLEGKESIKNNLLVEKEKGHKILVIDAVEDKDIDLIVEAVAEINIPFIAVDPGPFSSVLGNRLTGKKHDTTDGKTILAAVGSVTEITRNQIKDLEDNMPAFLDKMNAERLINPETKNDEINRVKDSILKHINQYRIIGVTTAKTKEDILNLSEMKSKYRLSEEDISNRIASGIGEVISKVLQEKGQEIGGLFVSGGDITLAVSQVLGATGIEVKDEVLPLAVYGSLLGGGFQGLPVLTKGGLIGELTGMRQCIKYLLNV